MHHKNIAYLILFLTPFLLSMSSMEESSASETVAFIGKVINFLLLFGGLTFLLRKPLGNFLQQRSDSLRSTMLEAEDSRQKAELKLKDIESRMEKLDEDTKRILQAAEAESADLRKSIVQETNKDVERLKRLARQEIERLTQAGIMEVREHMAVLATDLARQNILDRMSGEYQSSLIDRSIERLENLYEKPSADKKIRAGTH